MQTEKTKDVPKGYRAKQIKVISSMATRHILADLARDYERVSGYRVTIESVGGVEAHSRVMGGESFDIVVLASDAIDRLAAAGCVDPESRVDFARSNVAVAVTAGAPQRDISTEQALRDFVLDARSIGYSTGPSGVCMVRLFKRWGIAETVASRLVQAAPGVPVGELVARGSAQIGFQQLSELMDFPSIDVIGCLPPEINFATVFSIATSVASMQRQVAGDLQLFFSSPLADATKRRRGMEPAAE